MATTRDSSRDATIAAGRVAYGRRAWADAYDWLSAADAKGPLAAGDLEMLAWSAGLTGREARQVAAQERLYHLHADAGEVLRAARTAFWLGLRFLTIGDTGQGGAWLARADRLVGERDCVERAFLMLPVAYRHLRAGEDDEAIAVAGRAIAAGERFDEGDIIALGRNILGRAMVHSGDIEAGLSVLDEAMLAAAPGAVSPIVTGLVYCNVIECCTGVYALARSREWTEALAQWCAEQPDMVTFAGSCHVHRAELMQLSGAWDDALAEAQRASVHLTRAVEPDAIAPARYQEAEVHRLRGEFALAEAAYREASRRGEEPQPGLALLRLAQGEEAVAAAAIRRAVAAATEPIKRARLLPAYVEIVLAVGELDEADGACRELDRLAATFGSEILDAIAAHAGGALALARNEPAAAIAPLRKSLSVWLRFGAPYLAARVRVLIGRACGALGDAEGGALEFDAARAVFAELGARPDIARLDVIATGAAANGGVLTRRELQVLSLVADGKTNRAIAAELRLSGKTVDRHVSNIFNKLGVSSRAAATAHAIKHDLI